MKTLGFLLALAGGALVLMTLPPPAEAYDIFLTQWNQAEAEAAGDQVKVTVSGSTITFLWMDGNGIAPTATNLNKLFWSAAVVTQGGSIGTGSGDYAGVTDCAPSGCNADGFGKYRVEVDDSNSSTTTIGPISFTFSSPFSTTTLLMPGDFALQVQYSVSACGGFVDGTNVATTSNSACAPVPEPITMFLGGTGLLALGYAARKRLFGARLASAS